KELAGKDVEFKPSVNIPQSYGQTPLMNAAHRGHAGMVELLAGNGADVDASNEFKQTALHQAVQEGQLEAAKALLEAGADASMGNRYGMSALEMAINKGNSEMRELLEAAQGRIGEGTPNAENQLRPN
ncbi:MAG: ankyrin repeat domain-containing protein, partial [Candidatus Micrarchaeia archaeon]